ncbi:2-iminobutanoate/2-iminopropanoate deaminase isoform X2 [Eurytemora carolleeae]|uniref:2-iminobutanoate/2-iminopropanoate deaminase isoform X2 n=1 Tax=Eurytemora carolleeae TaxID=1294199 RepID=UPI000C78061F|nr:2-iminobutanoate/2-iminopropanoate deaminase isoform X2 [Eurytemora carolleeae]|eukprot:XP_023340724.1 2-iminobutanoate/2-iminopropanoate deaminase-like isoform X2 [Eurytemora affinis]
MASKRVIVETENAAAPVGPYSQAVVVDKTMYISGTLGVDPKTKELVPGGTVTQAKMALTNIEEILRSVKGTMNNIVKITVLMVDINEFAGVNDVYKTFFQSNFPARAAYQVW